jgi:ribonuclease BN (tRNA processing enzyme)
MKVVILGSTGPDGVSRQYASSYLINGTVAIDAGCLGFWGTPADQEAVDHVFLTHSHSDHVASLPVFLENVWTPSPHCPTIYGSAETLDSVQRHIFNGEIWPDFVTMSQRMPPFLRLETIEPEAAVEAAGLTITPVPVNHAVPTFAYVVRDQRAAVIFSADSGPTRRLWEVAHQTPDLKAVFLEASFPNRMRGVAEASLHLTPELAALEVFKLPQGVRVIAIHLKERYRAEIRAELQSLGLPLLEAGEFEKEYSF